MKRDRFLIGILVFIGLLVIAALVLFFIRNEAPAYGPEDTPEGVIHNYAVALQKRDFERAYSYLAEKENKPTLEYFRQAFLTRQLDISNTALQVGKAQIGTDDEAMVDVTIMYAGGPFSQGWSNTQTAMLTKQDGAWKIVSMPNPYWGWDWYQPTPVKP